VNGASPKAITAQIASGSEQATVVVIDIIGRISKHDLIAAIRAGWSKNTKTILFNYRRQWYEINHEKAYSDWIERNIK
jgi:hypothetical protein